MSKELTIIPRSIDEVSSLADVLAKSTLLPDAIRGKAPDIVVQILAGQELGLSPMASIRGVHVIQGKPVVAADTMVALVLGSGLCDYFSCVEDTDTRVTYETKRKGAPQPQRASWSVEDTKRAGLQAKDNWRLYPRAMMKARAKAILARDVYPDVLAGCYDPDELPAPTVYREPAAPIEDAEIIESKLDEAIVIIDGAPDEAALKTAAKQLTALGLSSADRRAANERYSARLKELRA